MILSLRLLSNTVHNPADVCKASAAFGVFFSALAVAEFLFGLNFVHYQRALILLKIRLNILAGMPKTVADVIVHFLSLIEPAVR